MKNVLRGVAHTLEAVTSECAEFNRTWSSTSESLDAFPPLWQGEWCSQTNGHHGALRCVLTRSPSGGFQAFFRAKYARFLRACYKVELRVEKQHSQTSLTGSTDLGPLAGGVYHYHGTITPESFTCEYRCQYDQGTFHLKPSAANRQRERRE